MEKNIVFGTGASSGKTYDELFPVIKKAIECGIRVFDTAPSYRTETVLAAVIKDAAGELMLAPSECRIQTKIDPVQMLDGKIEVYLNMKLDQMKLEKFDTVLIHWPVPDYLDQSWDVLTKLREKGMIQNIGICNVRMRQLRYLEKCKRLPDIIQIERNPLRTCDDEMAYCIKQGIHVQAYSPLCKMHPLIKKNNALKQIAERQNKNIGQIVMKWHIMTGDTPVFTTKKPMRIEDYTNLEDVILNESDIEQINSMNCNYKMYLESCICPGF